MTYKQAEKKIKKLFMTVIIQPQMQKQSQFWRDAAGGYYDYLKFYRDSDYLPWES